jgi:hypothetical protein
MNKLFWFGCIPTRMILVALAYYNKYNYLLKPICLLMGMGFVYMFIQGNKKALRNEIAWWHNSRLIHAFNFLMFGLTGHYAFLLIDVIIGMINKIYNNYK